MPRHSSQRLMMKRASGRSLAQVASSSPSKPDRSRAHASSRGRTAAHTDAVVTPPYRQAMTASRRGEVATGLHPVSALGRSRASPRTGSAAQSSTSARLILGLRPSPQVLLWHGDDPDSSSPGPEGHARVVGDKHDRLASQPQLATGIEDLLIGVHGPSSGSIVHGHFDRNSCPEPRRSACRRRELRAQLAQETARTIS